MNNIISLDEKLRLSNAQKAASVRRQKIQALHNVMQCTRCASKCERCGTSINLDPREGSDTDLIPYNFCNSCALEYRAYIDQLQGKKDPETYWHNDEWLHLWRRWIDYQGAVDQYKRSKEFLRLLDELRRQDYGGHE